MDRRQFIRAGSAASAASVLGLAAGCASTGAGAGGQVVVIGGGYGGATAAKYIRMWSEPRIQVTLVEPNDSFVSCPISNLVLGGSKQMADITTPYDNLGKRHGVKIVRDEAVSPSTSTSARCAWPAAMRCPTTG
jgi:sulfide dehydrogenase [flavocytochrome c] flavoprotein subunit